LKNKLSLDPNIKIEVVEAETDIKVMSVVRKDIPCVLTVLNRALDSNIVDLTRIEKYKDDIDKLSKSRATKSIFIASLVAKEHFPDWDTRYHEVQIGGKHSLRTYSGKVNNDLYMKDLLEKHTDYACLSPAFKGVKAPFLKNFTGSINPRESLPALLNILEAINTIEPPEKNDSLKNSDIICSNNTVSISNMLDILDQLYNLGNGSSVLPVIVVHTVLSVVQEYLWPDVTIKPLKEHTAPDRHGEPGDIEGVYSNSEYAIASEIKHKQRVTEPFIKEFQSKVAGKNIPLKFILTTANEPLRYIDNICINTVNGFVSTYLQMTLIHKNDICSIFLCKLRDNIVNHGNLNSDIRNKANDILKSLLESPSP
jgi:hypothetical protein